MILKAIAKSNGNVFCKRKNGRQLLILQQRKEANKINKVNGDIEIEWRHRRIMRRYKDNEEIQKRIIR